MNINTWINFKASFDAKMRKHKRLGQRKNYVFSTPVEKYAVMKKLFEKMTRTLPNREELLVYVYSSYSESSMDYRSQYWSIERKKEDPSDVELGVIVCVRVDAETEGEYNGDISEGWDKKLPLYGEVGILRQGGYAQRIRDFSPRYIY